MENQESQMCPIKSDLDNLGEFYTPRPSPATSEQTNSSWVATHLYDSNSPTLYAPFTSSSSTPILSGNPAKNPYQQMHSYNNSDCSTGNSSLEPYHKLLLKTSLLPDRAAIFQRVWNWSLAMNGMEPTGAGCSSLFQVETPLVWDLETLRSTMQCDQGRFDSRNFLSRGHMIALAEDYEKRAGSCGLELVSDTTSGWILLDGRQENKQPCWITSDSIVDQMTRELYALDSQYEFNPEDTKRKQTKIWVHVGRLLLALVREMGWGAMLVPGLQLTNDDIAKIDLKHVDCFVRDVRQCYSDWQRELEAISATVNRILVMGHPKGQMLRIQKLPNGSLPSDMNCSLGYWLEFVVDPCYQRASSFTPLLTPESMSGVDDNRHE